MGWQCTPFECTPGEPQFVNSNSYETVTDVLKNIGAQAVFGSVVVMFSAMALL